MRNRSFILLALLSANDRLGEPPVHRTTLVKQTYLAEILRPLYRIWVQTFEFVRYYYGPYSDSIFERLDTLIFSGLVEVTSIERRAGKVEARYRITASGHQLLGQLGESEIANLALDLIWALQAIGVEQATSICKLVYQEAEFARMLTQHGQEGVSAETKVPLPPVTAAGNETFTALATLQELQRLPGSEESVTQTLPTRELVRLFLSSLVLQVPNIRARQDSVA